MSEVSDEVGSQIAKTPLSLQENPQRMYACTLYFQKVESLAYIFVEESMGISPFQFVQWPSGFQMTRLFCNKVRFRRSRSYKVIQGRQFCYQSKLRV